MTITITIQNNGLSPGQLTGIYAKYLEMRREVGDGKVHWEERGEKKG